MITARCLAAAINDIRSVDTRSGECWLEAKVNGQTR